MSLTVTLMTSSVTNVASLMTINPTVSYSSSDIVTSVTSTPVAATSMVSVVSITVAADRQSVSDSDSDGLSLGIIIGTIVGVVLCIVLLLVVIILCYLRRRKRAQDFKQVPGFFNI